MIDECRSWKKELGRVVLDQVGTNRLLEEPFDVNDTLSVIPVGELTEDFPGKVDVAV